MDRGNPFLRTQLDSQGYAPWNQHSTWKLTFGRRSFLWGRLIFRIFQVLRLMQEILHHLPWMKPCKYWDIYHINWLAGCFPKDSMWVSGRVYKTRWSFQIVLSFSPPRTGGHDPSLPAIFSNGLKPNHLENFWCVFRPPLFFFFKPPNIATW